MTATNALRLREISIRTWRNLRAVDYVPTPGFNVIVGDNGQGKTNLLEAIYCAATSRSFRTSRMQEAIQSGESTTHLRAVFCEDGLERQQTMSLQAGARSYKMDGKRPPSLTAYASHSPVVAFHPAEMSLAQGGGAERRRLLDRVMLYLEPSSMDDLNAYSHALKARQKALELRGPLGKDLDSWEELLVRYGRLLVTRRERMAALVKTAAEAAFLAFGSPTRTFAVAYKTNVPEEDTRYGEALRQAREIDARRGSASTGPHRDDLELSLDDRSGRAFASQGQHRAMVMALKVAEVDVIAAVRGVVPVLLLDDISSEFDRDRLAALLRFLVQKGAQTLLTSTRAELFDDLGVGTKDRSCVWMVGGELQRHA